MSNALGALTTLGIGEEISYGTGVVASAWLEILEESIQRKQSRVSKPALSRVSQNRTVQSKKSVEGGFKFQVPFQGAEVIWRHALGAVADAPFGGGVFQHTYTPTNTLPVGLSLNVSRDTAAIGATSCFRYTGCQVNKLTLSQAPEDFLVADVELLGSDLAMVANPTPSYPTFYGIDWTAVSAASVQVNGVNVKLNSFEVTIDNNLAADRYALSQVTRRGLGRGGFRKVTGKLVLEFDSLTQYNLFANLTQGDVQITWNNGIGASPIRALALDMPYVFFDGEDPNAKDDGLLMLNMPFTAYAGGGVNSEITLYTINPLANG